MPIRMYIVVITEMCIEIKCTTSLFYSYSKVIIQTHIHMSSPHKVRTTPLHVQTVTEKLVRCKVMENHLLELCFNITVSFLLIREPLLSAALCCCLESVSCLISLTLYYFLFLWCKGHSYQLSCDFHARLPPAHQSERSVQCSFLSL